MSRPESVPNMLIEESSVHHPNYVQTTTKSAIAAAKQIYSSAPMECGRSYGSLSNSITPQNEMSHATLQLGVLTKEEANHRGFKPRLIQSDKVTLN